MDRRLESKSLIRIIIDTHIHTGEHREEIPFKFRSNEIIGILVYTTEHQGGKETTVISIYKFVSEAFVLFL